MSFHKSYSPIRSVVMCSDLGGVGCNWARIQQFRFPHTQKKRVEKPVDMSRSYEMKRLCRKAQENIWISITNEMRPACSLSGLQGQPEAFNSLLDQLELAEAWVVGDQSRLFIFCFVANRKSSPIRSSAGHGPISGVVGSLCNRTFKEDFLLIEKDIHLGESGVAVCSRDGGRTSSRAVSPVDQKIGDI